MRLAVVVFAFTAVALLPGCVAPMTRPVVLNPEPPRRLSGAEQVIDRYGRERACKGQAYTAARQYAARWLDSVVSDPTDAKRVAQAKANAQFRVRLAQAAARKRCFRVARETYAEVQDIFAGEPYAGLRQRAEAGLQGLPSH